MPICRKQQTVTNMNGSRTEAVKWKNGRRSCQATLGQIAETFWNILHEGNVPFLFCGTKNGAWFLMSWQREKVLASW